MRKIFLFAVLSFIGVFGGGFNTFDSSGEEEKGGWISGGSDDLGEVIFVTSGGDKLYRDPSKEERTFTDPATGLQWQDSYVFKYFDNPVLSWSDSIRYCEELNFAGFDDWRLPNINELLTLLDFEEEDVPLIGLSQMRSGIQYWSSTTLADDPSRAYILDVRGSSFSFDRGKFDEAAFRCVRGGMPVEGEY